MSSEADRPIYRAWTKGTKEAQEKSDHGLQWLVSRRAWFKVFSDRIECGNWTIPSSDVRKAVVFRARHGLIPVSILRLGTAEATYQFGFNPWVRIEEHLPFRASIEKAKFKISVFGLVVRLVVVVYLLYWLVQMVVTD